MVHTINVAAQDLVPGDRILFYTKTSLVISSKREASGKVVVRVVVDPDNSDEIYSMKVTPRTAFRVLSN